MFMWWILYLDIMWCLCMGVIIQHRVIWFWEKASLRICYAIWFKCKDLWMLKTDSLIFKGNIKYFTAQQILWCCVEKILVEKLKIVCSVTLSRLEFVSVPIADQLQPHFDKLPYVEQRITKPDWTSTMYSVVKYP